MPRILHYLPALLILMPLCCVCLISVLLGCGSGGGSNIAINALNNPQAGTARIYTHTLTFTAPVQPVAGTTYVVNVHINGGGQGTYDTLPVGYNGTFAWSYNETTNSNSSVVGTMVIGGTSQTTPAITTTTPATNILFNGAYILNWNTTSFNGGTITTPTSVGSGSFTAQ